MRALGVVIALLFVLSGCASQDSSFPHAYFLSESELPKGLTIEKDLGPGQTNPRQIDPNDPELESHPKPPPQEVWAISYEPPNADGDDETGILAFRWDAKDPSRKEKFAQGCESYRKFLATDDVIVMVWGDGDGAAYIVHMVEALREKQPLLRPVC